MLKNKIALLGGLLVSANQGFAAEPVVSFYGLVDVFVASSELPGATDRTFKIDSSGMTTSYFGVSTKIEVSEGLTGLAVIEGFMRPDVGEAGRYENDPFFSRDAFVGLEGNFGSVMLGRNTTPYFVAVISTNPFGGSFGFGPSIKHSFLGGLIADSSWSNTVAYSLPKTAGVSGTLMYSAGEIAGETGTGKIGGNLFYKSGDLTVAASYQSVDVRSEDINAPKNDNQSATLIGVKYKFGKVTLFAQGMKMEDELAAGNLDYDTYQLGASVGMGKGDILVSLAHTDTSGSTDTERDTAAIGYDHRLNEKIDLYTVYYYDDPSALDSGDSIAFGGRFRF